MLDIIPGRYVFSIVSIPPQTTPNIFCFTIENDIDFQYQPFFSDFGPFSLLQINIFLTLSLMHLSEHEGLIRFYCTNSLHPIANSILLAASFRLVCLDLSAEEALEPFLHLLPRVKPFRDASSFPSTFDLTIPACIFGLSRAIKIGWYHPNTFNPHKWAELETVDHGDMNWLIPNKLLAFASPYQTNIVQGFQVCTPSDVVPIFRELNIDTIIRLNNKTYEEDIFRDAGFKHLELYFPDGTCPPDSILSQFLEIVEGSSCIALHCKAGLGRTYFFLF
jgi:cell division cycle 14